MLSSEEIFLEYVCPAAGMICANIMFSAPYRDVKKATSETGLLGDLNPTPWGFMLGNCFGWLVYSFLIHNYFVFFANAPGLCLSVWLNMAAIKLQYENQKAAEMRKLLIGAFHEESSRRLGAILAEPSSLLIDEQRAAPTSQAAFGDYARIIWDVTAQHRPAQAPHERLVLGIVFYWLAIVSMIALGQEVFDAELRELVVGIAVNLNLVFFYGAPLSTIATVLKTRSSASIHIPTMITNTCNGIFWCAYGLAILDYYIAVPNILGALLGGIQVFLCLTFPRNKIQSLQVQEVAADAQIPLAPRKEVHVDAAVEEGNNPNVTDKTAALGAASSTDSEASSPVEAMSLGPMACPPAAVVVPVVGTDDSGR